MSNSDIKEQFPDYMPLRYYPYGYPYRYAYPYYYQWPNYWWSLWNNPYELFESFNGDGNNMGINLTSLICVIIIILLCMSSSNLFSVR